MVCSKGTEKKRKTTSTNLPDGSGWGDHIQLLQIYEEWHQTDYSIEWCKDNNLQAASLALSLLTISPVTYTGIFISLCGIALYVK